ncbi:MULTISPECIES: hypothetical protein [Bradyrhizobium]|uniref:hypothetical protein n=1 Tax=Bradyrhizobium TaxID=374 RepID=UPI00155EC738|nr:MULTISPECIES: hypothetical protein [Bradyrhizobium]UUO27690.1 hypothetical protein DCG74_10595 [Bradyrhizobium sp. WBAH42]
MAYSAAEVLLKGPELLLPDGRSFFDKDGHERREVRIRWWDRKALTFRDAALGMEGEEASLPELPIPTAYHYWKNKPVFFGHYWLQGTPALASDYAACLDFSVAKGGFFEAAVLTLLENCSLGECCDASRSRGTPWVGQNPPGMVT